MNPRILGSSTSRCYETMFWDFGARHNKASLAGRADDRAIALLTLDDSEKKEISTAAVISSCLLRPVYMVVFESHSFPLEARQFKIDFLSCSFCAVLFVLWFGLVASPVARLLGGLLAFWVRACLFSCPAPVCFGFWCFCSFFSGCGFARLGRYPLMATTVNWIDVKMDFDPENVMSVSILLRICLSWLSIHFSQVSPSSASVRVIQSRISGMVYCRQHENKRQ